MVMGSPGKVVRQLDEGASKMLALSAAHYVENWKRYAAGMKAV
jgi:carbonic anhydrase/acetyltransferase-like protein (isoleucine patch superfamily)